MTEGPIIPYLSRKTKTCETCQHWRATGRKAMSFAATPQGYMLTPLNDLIRENRRDEDAHVYLMSYCTAVPSWALMPSTHYCGQWKTDFVQRHAEELSNEKA